MSPDSPYTLGKDSGLASLDGQEWGRPTRVAPFGGFPNQEARAAGYQEDNNSHFPQAKRPRCKWLQSQISVLKIRVAGVQFPLWPLFAT